MNKYNNRIKFQAAMLLTFSFGLVNVASSAIITALSDDFESEALALNYTGFTNWTVSDGTVDTVGPTFGTPPIDCQSSAVCVDIDGSSNDAADFSTTDDFAAGIYTLSFDISGSQRPDTNTMTVLFGDLDEDFTLAGNDPWVTVERTVVLSSIDDLSFVMLNGDNSGILLDNVSVTAVPDTDQDSVFDNADNCTNVQNPLQQDADGDGHGNACDADFDQNCFTTFPDLSIMQAGFFTVDPLLDLNSSGGPVNFLDLAIMEGLFFLPPGPSAQGSLCNP